MDGPDVKPVTTRPIKASKRGRKKKFKGRSPSRSKKVIKSSRRGTPKASLTIVPAGDPGNLFFDESCEGEGQMILGEIVNAGEPDGETVPVKAEVKEENATEDADENQTEDTEEMRDS